MSSIDIRVKVKKYYRKTSLKVPGDIIFFPRWKTLWKDISFFFRNILGGMLHKKNLKLKNKLF